MIDLPVSIPAFMVTFFVLAIFTVIVARKKWKETSGKIFTIHLLIKLLWFIGIFLSGLLEFQLVRLGGILFVVCGWGLGYTMLLFFVLLYNGEEYLKEFIIYSLIATVIYFLTFFFYTPFNLINNGDGTYHIDYTNYFFIPALLLSFSYYMVVALLYSFSTKSASKKHYYWLFSIGLLIHALPAHTLVIMEQFFGFRNLIINMEYTSMFGFGIALYSFVFMTSNKK